MAKLNPYISFRSDARPALEFYRSVLGGSLDITTFGSVPGMTDDPADAELVMHGQLDTDGGLTLMAADTPSSMTYVAPTSGMTVAITGDGDDLDHVRGMIAGLSDGAADVLPFERAPWGDYYGQLTDRFGVTWMFNVGAQ
ncbi:VOC family protein [Isoptericola jiangsuensis]|uniref:VOC family protein n=1 Tax=Isoptericola jiangsuensis TaxID=548579 RepID=UPI003AAC6257